MKILFVNLPYHGHVVPTIGLVQELIRQGCEVTYLLPFDWEYYVRESGAEFYGYKNHKQLSEQIKHAYRAAEEIIHQFDLVVYEQFFFLGKHLAEQYHKPVVRIFTAPATNPALMQEFIQSGPLAIFQHKWIAKAFTKDIVKKLKIENGWKTESWLDEILYNPPTLNLVYTLRDYQPYEAEFPDTQYKFLGPSIYERKSMAFDYQKGTRPLVYISLGTVVKGAKRFYQACIDAFRDAPVDVIISVGNHFNHAKLQSVPSNIRLYHTVPQTEVLQMADLFVTHGGMNGVSEALVSSTPMVVIPFASDQHVNAKMVETLGVGRLLKHTNINRQTLKNMAMSVLADSTIKQNLINIQKQIEAAPGNRGGAEWIVKYYEQCQ